MADQGWVPSGSDLGSFAAWLSTQPGPLGIDTETTGLDPWAAGFEVRLLSVGAVSGDAWVIDARDRRMVQEALRLLVASKLELWAHNASYGVAALAGGLGVLFRPLNCSRTLVASLAPETIGSAGLKALRPATAVAKRRLAARWRAAGGRVTTSSGARDGHEDEEGGDDEEAWLAQAVAALPPDDPALLAYAAVDAVEVARLVAESIGSCAHDWVWTDQQIDRLFRPRQAAGYRLDSARLAREADALEAARAAASSTVGIDLAANTNEVRLWVARRGICVLDPDGKPTLAHKFWGRAIVPPGAEDDWALFREARTAARSHNTLVRLAKADRGGLIHPTIRAVGAKTGRMSSSGPGLQNVPAESRPVLSATPGRVLVGLDLAQVEPRVLAALSGDPNLRQAVSQGDAYAALAERVWRNVTPERRDVAKTALLAQVYGQGARSLGISLGVTQDEAERVVADLRASFPVAFGWIGQQKSLARGGRRPQTAHGRPLPPTPDKPYRAVNWTVQGTAADLYKAMVVVAARELPRDASWLPIHDELIVEVDQADAEEAARVLERAMSCDLHGVEIGGKSVVIGGRWRKC